MSYHTVNDFTIYYEQTGAGRSADPVIFLHDGLGSTLSWSNLPRKISEDLGRPGLAYDRAGYGRSCVTQPLAPGFLEEGSAFLALLMDSMQIERAHLVGHSDGASIALLFAASHRRRALSVIAEAPHTFVEDETRRGILDLVSQYQSEGLGWLERLHSIRAQNLFLNWTDVWLGQDHHGWDMREHLSKIEAPFWSCRVMPTNSPAWRRFGK